MIMKRCKSIRDLKWWRWQQLELNLLSPNGDQQQLSQVPKEMITKVNKKTTEEKML